jgi:hypothetical protein
MIEQPDVDSGVVDRILLPAAGGGLDKPECPFVAVPTRSSKSP